MGSFFHRKTKMIKKFLTYYTFPIIFVWLLVVSYNSSKRKPDSVMELITDPSWLYDWPKWLDIPLMKWINDGFKVFNEIEYDGEVYYLEEDSTGKSSSFYVAKGDNLK